MSTSRGSGGGNGGAAGAQPVPASARKIVQSLKEMIVNRSEGEIYATLKDCNMDANEAVNRLLSEDPFHEVKSKREKKKEGKDAPEPRSRGANNNANRGSKSGAERYSGRASSAPYTSSESAPSHVKPTYKKENGSTIYYNTTSPAPVISSRGAPSLSDGAAIENKGPSLGTTNGVPSSSWVGTPGQLSMADIVKMGRPNNKASSASNALNRRNESSIHEVPTAREEWPSIERPAGTITKLPLVPEYPVDSELHQNAPGAGAPFNSVDRHLESDEVQETEDAESPTGSSGKVPEDNASLFENDLYENMGSYQPQVHDIENHEVEEAVASLPSVTRDFGQINISKDDGMLPSEVDDDAPSVIIPDHLQVQTADCSHLSFGSFGSSINVAYSGGAATFIPVENDSKEAHNEADVSVIGYPEARNSEYFVDDSGRNASSDGTMFHRGGSSGVTYDEPSASQQEELKQTENAESINGHQYSFNEQNTGYTYNEAQHLNAAALSQAQISQIQNLTPFSSVMQSYPNSLPSTLLASTVHHPSRESDLQNQYSQYLLAQSMAAKYGNSVSPIDGSAISMSEALKTGSFSSSQPLSGTNNLTNAPPLPQHLAVHPYSQLGPFANLIGYPYLPQSYTYVPSAFQQTFAAGNNTYQSVLPQYKNSSSLPQSATAPSGYGAFGGNANVPGNFTMNQPPAAAPQTGTNLSYDDLLSSQYKESMASLQQQQSDNSGMWVHGPNSRAVPASTFYNYQGQNRTPVDYRQAQQQGSQHYGYPNFYHSQSGVSIDQQQQQQNMRDGSQGQPKQSQLWQNGY